MSIGVGGTGSMACAWEGVAVSMKNTRLTMNSDVFDAQILTFTGLRG
jgi:hypothetical protein